ncbi:hypothetical protein EI94DRAFT_1803485 [Lactarius quietus]|nr:hypothetical protein EI94DRAFT_1803485 [Lactarius quietus]
MTISHPGVSGPADVNPRAASGPELGEPNDSEFDHQVNDGEWYHMDTNSVDGEHVDSSVPTEMPDQSHSGEDETHLSSGFPRDWLGHRFPI